MIDNWANGVPTLSNQIPILRHFTGHRLRHRERYYEDRDKVRKGMSQVRRATKDRAQGNNVENANKTVEEGQRDFGARPGRKAASMTSDAERVFRDAEKRLKQLRTDRAKAIEARNRDAVALIEAEIRKVQDEARKAYKQIKQPADQATRELNLYLDRI